MQVYKCSRYIIYIARTYKVHVEVMLYSVIVSIFQGVGLTVHVTPQWSAVMFTPQWSAVKFTTQWTAVILAPQLSSVMFTPVVCCDMPVLRPLSSP